MKIFSFLILMIFIGSTNAQPNFTYKDLRTIVDSSNYVDLRKFSETSIVGRCLSARNSSVRNGGILVVSPVKYDEVEIKSLWHVEEDIFDNVSYERSVKLKGKWLPVVHDPVLQRNKAYLNYSNISVFSQYTNEYGTMLLEEIKDEDNFSEPGNIICYYYLFKSK